MINYTIYEDDKKLIVELNPPKDSSIDYQFLSENNFSKIEILYPEEKLIAEFDKDQELEGTLVKGVVVNGKYEPLQRSQHFETQLIKPVKEEKESLETEKLAKEEIDFKKVWVDPETGEIINKETGEVIGYQEDYQLSRSPEWRAYNLEQLTKRARLGPPVTATLHDKGLTTVIDFRDEDAHGKSLSLTQRVQAYRLRKWQSRMRIADNTERSLAYGLIELNRMSNLLELPRYMLETASDAYRKAVKQRLTRGRNIRSMIGSCIYYACRICKYPLGLSKLCFSLGLNEKEVAKGYRALRDKLEYKIDVPQPFPFISKLVNRLYSSSKTEEIALKIAKAAKESRKLTSGWDPLSIAGASVYIASQLTGEPITQTEIANEICMSDVTIRNRYHDLEKNLLFEISL
jgi:transcription initiation factor TFIIB